MLKFTLRFAAALAIALLGLHGVVRSTSAESVDPPTALAAEEARSERLRFRAETLLVSAGQELSVLERRLRAMEGPEGPEFARHEALAEKLSRVRLGLDPQTP